MKNTRDCGIYSKPWGHEGKLAHTTAERLRETKGIAVAKHEATVPLQALNNATHTRL